MTLIVHGYTKIFYIFLKTYFELYFLSKINPVEKI